MLLLVAGCVPILIAPSVIVHAIAGFRLRFRSHLGYHPRVGRWIRLLWIFMLIRIPIVSGVATAVTFGLPTGGGRIDSLLVASTALGVLALLGELYSEAALGRQIALAIHHDPLARGMKLQQNLTVIMFAITTLIVMIAFATRRGLTGTVTDMLAMMLLPSIVVLLFAVLGIRDLTHALDLERAEYDVQSSER